MLNEQSRCPWTGIWVREGTVYPIRPFLDPGKLFPSAGQAQLALLLSRRLARLSNVQRHFLCWDFPSITFVMPGNGYNTQRPPHGRNGYCDPGFRVAFWRNTLNHAQ
jgi:hypothetical protein